MHQSSSNNSDSANTTGAQDTTSGSLHNPLRTAIDALEIRVVAARAPTAVGRVAVVADGLVLGRAEGPGQLYLDDSRVSRIHARVEGATPRGPFRLVDASSKNGLRANGAPVNSHVLSLGDVLRMGDTLLIVDRASVPLSRSPVDFVAEGAASRLVRAEIDRVGPTDLSVVLTGASGTGKEVLARALHTRSQRLGPFHAVNCGAIPKDLVEASLFGHRRGAFTGAVSDQDGHFVAAHGGTIFLDEVAELSASAQVALLRVLETRELTPVGSTQHRAVTARVIVATHQDLPQLVRDGTFRDDLYARLAEWPIAVPSLAERKADIPELVRWLVPPGVTVSVDALEGLLLDPWPHNVRGLRTALRQAEVRAAGATCERRVEIDLAHLGAELAGRILEDVPLVGAPRGPFERPTHAELTATLALYRGQISLVAAHFGKDRRQIYRWLEYAGIERPTGGRRQGEPPSD